MNRRVKRWIIAIAALPLVLTVLYSAVTPVSTLMLGRYILFRGVERHTVALSQMPAHLPRALIASEDGRYCRHHGVDWREIANVARQTARDGAPNRGASTLSMQIARNLFLWQSPLSGLRKIFELPLAMLIDSVWTKRRQLEIYLNIAEWGPDGRFGIEAGARHAFGKSARQLTAHEAALLVAILPNPHKRSAARPSPLVARKAAAIARRMAQADVSCLSPA